MTQLDEFFVQIAKFVLNKTDFSFTRTTQTIIKSHSEKLWQTGDIGFPTTVQPWLNAVENPNDLNDLKQLVGDENQAAFARKLIEISSSWMFPIQTVQFGQFRCLLFLDRPKCYAGILKTVLYDDASYGQWYRSNGSNDVYKVQLMKQAYDNSLIEHRCMLVAKVLTNLMEMSGFQMALNAMNGSSGGVFDGIKLVEILVGCANRDDRKRQNRRDDYEQHNNNNNNNNTTTTTKPKMIICGSVTSKSGFSAGDIIRLRSADMEKMAESKYGSNKENAVIDKCQKLGAAVVIFDLLKVKHYNAIDLEKLMKATSPTIKGAAFILYNVARLQTLLATFEQQVAKGFYAPLPAFDQIDFGLLKTEEEWQMLFVYVIGFPSMLERCINGIANGHISIHLVCTFLSNLAALFSVYYHRIKILTDNLPQLMPVMYARIYFLKALRVIFLKMLMILEIEPLDEM